jgi:RNA polymerase-associated protein RTF1
VPVPKKAALVDKIDDINRLVNRSWTEQELTDKLNRQNKLKSKFSGAQRERVQKALEAALAAGNQDKAAKLQEELDKLPAPRLAFRTSLTPASGTPSGTPQREKLSQQERLAQINAENRRKNAEAVRQAQLKERAKAREIEARIQRGEQVDADMSRRVRTKPQFIHESDQAKAAAKKRDLSVVSSQTASPGPAAKPKEPLLPHMEKLKQLQQQSVNKAGVAVIHKPLMDDDIIGALDLDIDIDI